MANELRFISSLLTTSPYPNSKMFKVGFNIVAYIYGDGTCYKHNEYEGFLYCWDQDDRDPEGETTLAIYYSDPNEDYEDEEDYVEWSNDHPSFYRGTEMFEGVIYDKWDMYEVNSEELVPIMTFLTPVVVEDISNIVHNTIDLTQYCPIYEDLLKAAFETSKFPNTAYSNTLEQVAGPNGVVKSTSPYIYTPGSSTNIDGLNLDYIVFLHGLNPQGSSSYIAWNWGTWGGKSILFYPGYFGGNSRVDSTIFATGLTQTGSISTTTSSCYFPIIDIDLDNFYKIVSVIPIKIHTPTIIFWGMVIYNGHRLVVPVAVVTYESGGTTVSSRQIIDWKSFIPY